ncbi:MAG: DUF255 domain-containing protein [Planctomycetota bacterium]
MPALDASRAHFAGLTMLLGALIMLAHAQNRLATESSPYLLQHQNNPVDWYPWGEEAFAEARRRDVPIFLSVGYSTCYWCHVMERESFEDEATADVINELFVNVKLDREERPDIDAIYMHAVQLYQQGGGGWPMSVWLTPPGARSDDDTGLKPIYAGTYYPPDDRFGRQSFTSVGRTIATAWRDQREDLLSQADRAAAHIAVDLAARETPVRLETIHVARGVETLLSIHDREHGGFGQAPKFPQPVFLDFLLDVVPTVQEPAVRSAIAGALRLTADRMAMGGMYDQIGGGFHRYSTDDTWTVPHFEKMLYDQAQLAHFYARMFAASRDPFDERILRETLDFVMTEMTDEAGGFHSALDAEAEDREGLTYVWDAGEIEGVLSANDAAFARTIFALGQGPNFQDPHHQDEPRRIVLTLGARDDRLAEQLGLSVEQYQDTLARIQRTLLEHRRSRTQPALDDKVIVSWNGLMIAGFANAAVALREQRYLDAAARAADFILDSMGDGDGGLLRVYRAGEAKTPGFLEDYAFLIHGLLALHRASAIFGETNLRYINAAQQLRDHAQQRFGGPNGELFDTLANQSDLFVRTMATADGAIPSGQSVMLHNDLDLREIASDAEALDRAEQVLATMSADVNRSPAGSINATRALLRMIAIDPELPDRLGPASPEPASTPASSGAPTADAPAPADSSAAPVAPGTIEIYAPVDRVSLTEQEQSVQLRLSIPEGYHLSAFDPGPDDLPVTPLELRVEDGEGVLVRVEAPEPTQITAAGMTLNVYEGEVDVRVFVRRDPDVAWQGRPLLVLRYQVCTETECLIPQAVELDVALDRGD